MDRALLYLSIRSVRGRVVRALRLLKEPKYLIGVLVFIGWMGFWTSSAFIFDGDGGSRNVEFAGAEMLMRVMGDALPALQLVVAVALALVLSLWWLLPFSRMALDLTEAEIHMLTPMPVKRRHLIQYATLKSQPGILFGCTIMTVFLGVGGPLARIGWFGAFWLVLTLWDLHSKGRALWIERQKELAPQRAWRNRLLLIGGIVVYWIVLGTALSELVAELMTLPPPPDYERTIDFIRETLIAIRPRLESGVIGWLLLPFRWVTAPVFVAAPGADLQLRLTGLVMPLVLLVAHNEWVVRSRTMFEEAALAHARREANKKSTGARYWKTSMRSRHRTSFPLPPQGAPEIAILWKNALQVTRFSFRTLLLFGFALVGLALLLCVVFRAWMGAPMIVLSIGFMTMLLTPLTAAQGYRNDLRTDLQRLEMIRPWPIAGWKLFAAEAAGPAVFGLMTAAVGAAVVLAMDLYLTIDGTLLAELATRNLNPHTVAASLGVPRALLMTLALLGIVPLLAAMTCLSATLQNLIVLLFPGWVQLGNAKQQGAAAFGQNMLMFFGLGLAGLICLLPAGLLIGAIVLLQRFAFGIPVTAWEFPVFGIIAATPVSAVVAVIVRAGGRVWERLDASQEILEGGS